MAAAPFLRLVSGDSKVAGGSVLSICVRRRIPPTTEKTRPTGLRHHRGVIPPRPSVTNRPRETESYASSQRDDAVPNLRPDLLQTTEVPRLNGPDYLRQVT